jgi:PEP-CTERM motif
MKVTSLLLLAGLALAAPSAMYAGPVVFQQNFDNLPAQLARYTVAQLGNFHTLNGTNVDIAGPADGYGNLCVGPESGNCLDLAGTNSNSMGQLQSTAITLGPGTYDFSFDLIGSQRKGFGTTSTTVTLGTLADPGQLYDQSFNNLAYNNDTAGIVNTEFSVSKAETVYLNFDLTADGSPNVGPMLDNILITQSSAPEPSSLLLLGTGLFALAGFAIRKTAVNTF